MGHPSIGVAYGRRQLFTTRWGNGGFARYDLPDPYSLGIVLLRVLAHNHHDDSSRAVSSSNNHLVISVLRQSLDRVQQEAV